MMRVFQRSPSVRWPSSAAPGAEHARRARATRAPGGSGRSSEQHLQRRRRQERACEGGHHPVVAAGRPRRRRARRPRAAFARESTARRARSSATSSEKPQVELAELTIAAAPARRRSPGPSPSACPGRPGCASFAASSSASTKSTEAEERLPDPAQRAATSGASASGGSSSAVSKACEHLGPAGVGDPVADVRASSPWVSRKPSTSPRTCSRDEARHLRAEDDLEPAVHHVPAHDALGVRVEDRLAWPARAAPRPRWRPARRRRAPRRRAVAEEPGGDDVRDATGPRAGA